MQINQRNSTHRVRAHGLGRTCALVVLAMAITACSDARDRQTEVDRAQPDKVANAAPTTPTSVRTSSAYTEEDDGTSIRREVVEDRTPTAKIDRERGVDRERGAIPSMPPPVPERPTVDAGSDKPLPGGDDARRRVDPLNAVYGWAAEPDAQTESGSTADGTRPFEPADESRTDDYRASLVTPLRANGDRIHGRIVSDDGEKVMIETLTPDGIKAQVGVSYGQLHPATVAALRAVRTNPDDVEGHLGVAEYADENGLYHAAHMHYLQVRALDPDRVDEVDKRIDSLRTRAAEDELERGRAALADGDDTRGTRILERLMREFGGTPSALEAAHALDEYEQGQQLAQDSDEWDEHARPVLDVLRRSSEAARSALQEDVHSSRATRGLESALDLNAKARTELAAARKSVEGDGAVAAGLESIGARIDAQFVGTQLHLASVLLIRGSYAEAQKAVTAALERAPEDREALAMRTRIVNASHADDDDWVWLRRRGEHPFDGRRLGVWRRTGAAPMGK